MTETSLRSHFAFLCSGYRLCMPAESVQYLASVTEMALVEQIPAVTFGGCLYPVYSLQDGLRPAMGPQEQDTHCLVLRLPPALEHATTAIALACSAVFKFRSPLAPQSLPPFMLANYTLIGGMLRQQEQWWHMLDGSRLLHFLEQIGFQDDQQQQSERLAG